jgi:hypothetical protein
MSIMSMSIPISNAYCNLSSSVFNISSNFDFSFSLYQNVILSVDSSSAFTLGIKITSYSLA